MSDPIEGFLDTLPDDRRAAIEAVRRLILERLPTGYEETVNRGMLVYQIPLSTYPDTYNGEPLVYAALGSQKNHMTLYLNNVYMSEERRAEFERRFAEAGKKLDAGKSCVRLRSVDDLPLDLIGDTIASDPIEGFLARYEEVQGARKAAARKQTATKKKTSSEKTGTKKKRSGRRTK